MYEDNARCVPNFIATKLLISWRVPVSNRRRDVRKQKSLSGCGHTEAAKKRKYPSSVIIFSPACCYRFRTGAEAWGKLLRHLPAAMAGKSWISFARGARRTVRWRSSAVQRESSAERILTISIPRKSGCPRCAKPGSPTCAVFAHRGGKLTRALTQQQTAPARSIKLSYRIYFTVRAAPVMDRREARALPA